ncbi:MAG: DUF3341 domain-containing protein [Candidatus Hydrogenedentota bacterium]
MSDASDKKTQVYGVIAEFEAPEPLLHAARRAYKDGYRAMDAYSPFPIEGMGEVIGMKSTGIPPLVFAGGVAGALGGFAMQHFASVIHYPYDIGGKPFFSWPAFIPITFELMVLLAAFACFFGLLGLCGLPRPHHPIFNAKNFDRASTDRFFLCIECRDRQYDAAGTRAFLEQFGPVQVSEVMDG